MSTSVITVAGHAGQGQGSLLSNIGQRFSAWLDGRARRAEARRVREQIASMDDRMLLDIGLDEGDIARIRSGDQFVPTLVRFVGNGVGFSA